MTSDKINSGNIDALREVFSIGAGHASGALSEMTEKKITVAFPSVKEYKIEDITYLFGSPETLVATVFLNIDGVFEEKKGSMSVGNFILMFEKDVAVNFSNLIQKQEGYELDSMALDSLKETGNILSGSCLNAISEFLDFKLIESLPKAKVDMLGSTLDSFLATFAGDVDKVLLFRTSFLIESKNIESYLFLLFDPEVLNHIVKKIQKIQND